jgi:hypothetical protein
LSITPFIIAGISLGMADADPGGERVPDLIAEADATSRSGHRAPRRGVARR